MNDHHELDAAGERLDSAVAAMRGTRISAVPETVIRQTRQAMKESRRLSWQSRLPRVAAAAMVAVALVAIAIALTQTRPAFALAEVAEQVSQTKTLRAVVVDPREGGTLLASGTRTRFEANGAVVISDSATGQEIMLDSNNKLAYRMPAPDAGPALDFYGLFRELAASASTPIDDYVDHAGRRYPGASGAAKVKLGEDQTWEVDAKVWSDPATKLPVRLEIRPKNESGEMETLVIEEIEFDVPLDDELFDMSIPDEYTLVGLTADKLKPPPGREEAQKLTIVPGVGIGEVKFGMSLDQIVAVLGEPDFDLYGQYFNYSSLGLQLVLVGREPNKLGMIIANPYDAASLTRNDFPGQTDKGIRIGSTRQEVLEAYGQPDPHVPGGRPITQQLNYNRLGLSFSLAEGKVLQIFAARTD